MNAQRLIALLLVWIAAAAAAAEGEPPSGRLQLELQLAGAARDVAVEVRVSGGEVGGEEPATLALRAPGKGDVALPVGLWRVEARAEGYWAKSAVVVIEAGATQSATVRLWPTAQVSGRFLLPPEERRPEVVQLRFQAPVANPNAQAPLQASAGAGAEEADIACRVLVSNHFRCAVPLGVWHLRLWPTGYVAQYFWNVNIATGKGIQLGDIPLQRGASVAGWLPTCTGAFAASCEVELQPQAGMATAPSQRQTLSQRTLAGLIDEGGFFQVQGVPAGSYALVARQPGLAPRRVFPVLVVADGATELTEPLVLEPPLILTVELHPATDPWGKPWHVGLMQVGAAADHIETVVADEAAVGGRWQHAGLSAGQYRLRVRDGQRNIWLAEPLHLQRGQESFAFDLPVIAVAGTVSLGSEPLPWARLQFEGIRIDADEAGRFEGFLPYEGPWTVRVESRDPRLKSYLPEVEVRRRPGKLLAEVDLRLADTRLVGSVVNANGEPVPDAIVLATSLVRAQRVLWESANERGRFELRGLAPGEWWLHAEAQGETSGRLAVTVQETSSAPPVRLQLRRQQTVTGRVVGPDGPVPGAVVVAYGLNAFDPETTVTDGGGRFSLRLPKEQQRLPLAILPPGYHLRALEVPLAPGQPLELVVHQDGGGSLVLQGDMAMPSGWPSDVVLAFHNGVALTLLQLQQWAQMQGMPGLTGESRLIPRLEYGDYAICRVPVAQLFAAVDSPPQAHCTDGYLAPGSELTLTVPGASTGG